MNPRPTDYSDPQGRSRRMLDVLNRRRLKLAALLLGLALIILIAEAALRGSAY